MVVVEGGEGFALGSMVEFGCRFNWGLLTCELEVCLSLAFRYINLFGIFAGLLLFPQRILQAFYLKSSCLIFECDFS